MMIIKISFNKPSKRCNPERLSIKAAMLSDNIGDIRFIPSDSGKDSGSLWAARLMSSKSMQRRTEFALAINQTFWQNPKKKQ